MPSHSRRFANERDTQASTLSLILITLSIFCIFILRVLSTHQWDPLSLVLLTPDDLPAGQDWGVGYDGRFSYHIAVNPLGFTDGLDEPNYRYQRILYPLLVKWMSLGRDGLVPWMMIVLNLVAAALCTALLGRLLLRRRASAWLALAFSLSVGFLLAMRMDLLEPLAFALALAGLLSYEQRRPQLAVLFFALGGLTKEVALLFPLALAAWELLRGRGRRALMLALGSLTPFFLLYLFLAGTYGVPPAAVEKSRFLLIPFSGIRYLQDWPSRVVVGIWALIPAAGYGLWALRDLIQARFEGESSRDAILVLVHAALIALLPAPTWEDPLAIFRLALGLIAAVLLWLASSHRRALPYAFSLWIVSGVLIVPIPGML